MRRSPAILAVVLMIVVGSSALGTSFVLPPDEWLIERADAIATGTVVDRETRRGSSGLIETVYTFRIDDALKGLEESTREIRIVEPGGVSGDEILRVVGTPDYEIGSRYLVFLRQAAGQWTTFDLQIGAFAYRVDETGRPVLVRDEHVAEGGGGFADPLRDAGEFVSRVKDVVRHPRPEQHRLEVAPEEGAEPGDVRLAAQVAAGSWSGDEASSIRYSVSTLLASGEATGDDGEDRVIAGDPFDLIPGTLGIDSSILAVAYYGCRASGCTAIKDPVNGNRWAGIAWADVVLNDVAPNLVLSQAMLNTVVAHEFGHTLGFRHSNRVKNDRDASSSVYACSEPLPCSTRAIMTASSDETLNGSLAEWDRDAANAVYGDGSRTEHTPSEYVDDMYVEASDEMLPARRITTDVAWKVTRAGCRPISIEEHPQPATVASGGSATFKVVVDGGSVAVTWFEGEKGDTTRPVGQGSTLTVEGRSNSTRFWAQVVGPCSTLESDAAVLTVRPPCPEGALCALSDRFRISLRATDQRTSLTGRGLPMPENDLFGSFSLPELTGNPENPEVFVKLLDGREVNGEFWVFYGGLTDLDYVLTVADVDTGSVRRYHKPAGSTAGGFDVGSGVSSERCSAEVDGIALQSTAVKCEDGSGLCLDKGRFGVELAARDPRTGKTASGEPSRQSDIAGYFALPALTGNPKNPEVFVKVLDGRTVNGHHWVFFSGLTDLEYELVVTDRASGRAKAYVKPAGSACGAFDTDAF